MLWAANSNAQSKICTIEQIHLKKNLKSLMQASNLRKNKKPCKPKISKIMEIKIRNQGNYRKSMKKIKTKSWFFDKINKIGKQLVNITKKKPRQKTAQGHQV